MFPKILTQIFGSRNDRLLKTYRRMVDEINALEPRFEQFDDTALRAKTDEFRQRLASGSTLDDLLTEAFAVVREAGKRTLKMRHFDVQLKGGMALHQGKIAEMRTGEGKTLMATLPVYLNALAGQGVHLVTVNDYLVRAVALALVEVPGVNIQVHGTEVHHFASADIAIAVATEKGLLTPVLRGAEQMSLAEIGEAIADLAARARAGKLKQDEIEGGSFSLSNLGPYGVEQFDAIINPPQGAILAVGAARSEPIDDDGAIRIVPVLHLSLSCDHRAIDGADGARFLAALAGLIEHPDRL